MTMSLGRWLPLALCVAVSFSQPAMAKSNCLPLSGFVRLDPDDSCKIAAKYPGNRYILQPGTCFSVKVRGPFGRVIIGRGSAGLTSESHFSPLAGVEAATPSILNESGLPTFTNELGLPETRRFVTARSAIDMLGGRLFSADAGVISSAGSSEQLLITGGTGRWVGATGTVYIRGNSFKNWGRFSGLVCTP